MPTSIDTLEIQTTEPLSPRCGRERIAHLASRLYHLDPALPPLTVTAPATGQLIGQVSRGSAADRPRGLRRRAQGAGGVGRTAPSASAPRSSSASTISCSTARTRCSTWCSSRAARPASTPSRRWRTPPSSPNYYAEHAGRHLRPRRRKGALPGLTVAWEHHHPRGVVAIIAPWNYPLTMAITDAIPALMAGNAVVLKPDHQTPFTALWVAELLEGAGLPPGLFQVIPGEGRRAGAGADRELRLPHFHRSTATGGRWAGRRASGCWATPWSWAARTPCSCWRTPTSTRRSRVPCAAASGAPASSASRSSGSSSTSPSSTAFADRFVRETQSQRLGASFEYDMDIGCLISEAHLAKVEEHVQDAVAKGATVLAGGKRRPDLGPTFYEPTILTGVTPEMKLFAEETFGPVVAIYSFDSVHDAIERANASRYGLNASVWTRDLELGHRVAARLQCGTVNVNEAYAAAWASVDAPMGRLQGLRPRPPPRRRGHPQVQPSRRPSPSSAACRSRRRPASPTKSSAAP